MLACTPRVSIITPSYNKGQFIEETIQSVLNQTYQNIEFIVMDGGSTDETLDILKKYGSLLSWKSEQDSGQSDAINKGWKSAKGEIIAYLNADDIYYSTTVETVVNYFNDHPETKIIYGDGVLTDESGKEIGRHNSGSFCYHELLYGKNFILQPTVFFRRELLTQIGYLDTTLHLTMDLDFWIRAGYRYPFGYIQQPSLAGAKIYAGTKTELLLYKTVDELEYIIEKFYRMPDVDVRSLPVKQVILNYIYCKGGLDCIHMKKPVRGLQYLLKAFRLSPLLCTKNVTHHLLKFFGHKGSTKLSGPSE